MLPIWELSHDEIALSQWQTFTLAQVLLLLSLSARQYMKNLILKLVTIIGVLSSSLHSFAEFSSADFNEMIQENQKSETELRKKLQKDAGIDQRKVEYGKIDRSKLQIPKESEQVAVSGGTATSWKPRKDRAARELQKAEMSRVAEELKQAESN